jgi:hypothetical protein
MDCRILGVVEMRENTSEIRPVVMIDRRGKANAAFQVQIAFIDAYGQPAKTPDGDQWRVQARAEDAPAFAFDLRAANAVNAHPVAPAFAETLVDWLGERRNAVLDDGIGSRLRMPRGALAKLVQTMDRLQRPKTDPLSAAERSAWLKQYHYKIVHVKRATGAEAPDDVKFGCDERPYPRYIDALQLDPEHVFWIAHCPEGSRMFLQKSGREPIDFDLRRFNGGVQRDVYSDFDPQTSLLTVEISQGQRGDCGQRVRFGWTDQQNFGMIEHRRMTMCRHVPANLWPLFWSPTRWSYVGGPPSSSGDAAGPSAR